MLYRGKDNKQQYTEQEVLANPDLVNVEELEERCAPAEVEGDGSIIFRDGKRISHLSHLHRIDKI